MSGGIACVSILYHAPELLVDVQSMSSYGCSQNAYNDLSEKTTHVES